MQLYPKIQKFEYWKIWKIPRLNLHLQVYSSKIACKFIWIFKDFHDERDHYRFQYEEKGGVQIVNEIMKEKTLAYFNHLETILKNFHTASKYIGHE